MLENPRRQTRSHVPYANALNHTIFIHLASSHIMQEHLPHLIGCAQYQLLMRLKQPVPKSYTKRADIYRTCTQQLALRMIYLDCQGA